MSAVFLGTAIEQTVFPALGTVLTAGAMWVATWAVKVLKIHLTGAQAAQVEVAIQHGIAYALDKAEFVVDQKSTVEVKSAVVAAALEYVLPKVPRALAGLGIGPDGLAQRIAARLPAHLPNDSTNAGSVEPTTGEQPIY